MKTGIRVGNIVPNYDHIYSNFTQNCLNQVNNLDGAKKAFLDTKLTFLKAKEADNFCQRTAAFVPELIKRGSNELANIFLVEISKLYMSMRNYQAAEGIIKKSLDMSREMGDNFHVLARLNDLQTIYKEIRNRREYFNVLRDKKACLKEMINNYDENLTKYRSITRPATRLSSLKFQLAYVFSDISDLLKYNNLNNSIRSCQKALEIFEELGSHQQIKYFRVKLQRLMDRMGAQGNQEIAMA